MTVTKCWNVIDFGAVSCAAAVMSVNGNYDGITYKAIEDSDSDGTVVVGDPFLFFKGNMEMRKDTL